VVAVVVEDITDILAVVGEVVVVVGIIAEVETVGGGCITYEVEVVM
jgi:hypothetical protein